MMHQSLEESIMFQKAKKLATIEIKDNGNGIDPNTMQNLLYYFGSHKYSENYKKEQFGNGFKLAVMRLAKSALIISRTKKHVTIALISIKFMDYANSNEVKQEFPK